MPEITGRTQLLGVMGDPIEHSLSPAMHNAALAELGLDWAYVPFPVQAERLEAALAGLAAIGVVGFNVTLPHKQRILPQLQELSDAARLVGAVNTVYRTEAGWGGTNTDVDGFVAPLWRQRQDWSQAAPLILGNGGAARAAVVGCARLGCRRIRVVGRDRAKLAQFQQSWQAAPLGATLETHPWDALPQLVPQTALLVNTTPIGMAPHTDGVPLEPATLAQLPAGAIAYDLIYTPRPTRLLTLAQQQGAIALDGAEMLVQQGAAALSYWLQQPVPDGTMREVLLQRLER